MIKRVSKQRVLVALVALAAVAAALGGGITYTETGATNGIAVGSDGRGVAAGDVDGDGFPDLVVAYRSEPNKLFLADGAGDFSDAGAFLGGAPSQGIYLIDYDGDGDLDVHVVRPFSEADGLFRQDTGPTFTDVSGPSGLADTRFGGGAVWFDFDRDGRLDTYVCNGSDASGESNALYKNLGGTFVDVAASAGVELPNSKSFVGAAILDFDRDGWTDLFVTEFGGRAHLFRNRGDATFEDVSAAAGADVLASRLLIAKVADFDNDGWQDLFLLREQESEILLLNDRGGGFVDAGLTGAITTQGPGIQDCTAADYDRDGDLDLLITVSDPGGGVRLFENQIADGGGLAFVDVSVSAGISSTARAVGLAAIDSRRLGRTDVGSTVRAARSRFDLSSPNSNHWIAIDLSSSPIGATPFDAFVIVRFAGQEIRRMVGEAFHRISMDDPTLVFGLGGHADAVTVEIVLSDGTVFRGNSVADRVVTFDDLKERKKAKRTK